MDRKIVILTPLISESLKECGLLDKIGEYIIVDYLEYKAMNFDMDLLSELSGFCEPTAKKINTDIISHLQKKYKKDQRRSIYKRV